jgi:hypothetical protein
LSRQALTDVARDLVTSFQLAVTLWPLQVAVNDSTPEISDFTALFAIRKRNQYW